MIGRRRILRAATAEPKAVLKLSPITNQGPTPMQTHLLASAVERVAVFGAGVHLVLVYSQALEVSASVGRCSACAGLLRQKVAVGRHLVQRAGVGDAAVPVGRHLVIVCEGAELRVAALVGLRRELELVCCLLWAQGEPLAQCKRDERARVRCGRWEAGSQRLEAGRRWASGRGVPELSWVPPARTSCERSPSSSSIMRGLVAVKPSTLQD